MDDEGAGARVVRRLGEVFNKVKNERNNQSFRFQKMSSDIPAEEETPISTIYISVIAEGPTRVLVLSDDASEAASIQQESETIQRKLAVVDAQISEVTDQLKRLGLQSTRGPPRNALKSSANASIASSVHDHTPETALSDSIKRWSQPDTDLGDNHSSHHSAHTASIHSPASVVKSPAQVRLRRSVTNEAQNDWLGPLTRKYSGRPEGMLLTAASKTFSMNLSAAQLEELGIGIRDDDDEEDVDEDTDQGLARESLQLIRSEKQSMDASSSATQIDPIGSGRGPSYEGEIAIRVIRATGLGGAGGEGILRDRCSPYVCLELENQKICTLAKPHTRNPVWDETIIFRSISSKSVLRVRVFSEKMLVDDEFLGEHYVSLDKVSEGVTGTYHLGRRNVKDKVSGTISLSFSWNRTPLEGLLLQLKTKEQELVVKEHLLGLLQKQSDENEVLSAGSEFDPAVDTLDGMESSQGITFHKKGDTGKEVYEKILVRVIEARNLQLNMPSVTDANRRNYCNSYARVQVKGKRFGLSQRTRMIPNAFNPQWNYTCEFEDVPSDSSLKILILNKQRIRADAVIGKV
eukprot:scaffold2580_cov388-Prasinococcus_capsulatus_cf.AAC.15